MESEENKLDENTENRIKKDIDYLLEEKELKIKWRKELEENDSITEYLKQFNPHSVTGFFDSYLTSKYQWYRFGDMYRDMIEAAREEWITAAHEHLENILHKKLFDLQCLWRANEIKLEGVEICYDFVVQGQDIFNCNFIDDITEQEVEMYQEFLLNGNLEFKHWLDFSDLQDYDEIKQAYDEEDAEYNFPDWYEFHNMRTGKSSLLLLPDIRGEEEQFYINLHFENQSEIRKQEIANGNTPVVERDNRPFFSYHNPETLEFFINTFEDREFQKKYKYYNEGFKNDYDENEDYEEIFMKMMESKEPIPIKEHYDFKQAIVQAYHEFKCKKIAEHLPLAHEQYLFNKQMGFSFGNAKPEYGTRSVLLNNILNGRELNGEERNLDF